MVAKAKAMVTYSYSRGYIIFIELIEISFAFLLHEDATTKVVSHRPKRH